MITQISLENARSIKKAVIFPSRLLTALIAHSGSSKSSVIQTPGVLTQSSTLGSGVRKNLERWTA